MKVSFGSYPDNRGHVTSNGCFRCHDDSHKASDGSTISGDCGVSICRKQIENLALIQARLAAGTVGGLPARPEAL